MQDHPSRKHEGNFLIPVPILIKQKTIFRIKWSRLAQEYLRVEEVAGCNGTTKSSIQSLQIPMLKRNSSTGLKWGLNKIERQSIRLNEQKKSLGGWRKLMFNLTEVQYQSRRPSTSRDNTPFSTDINRLLIHLFYLNFNNYASLTSLIRPWINLDIRKQRKGVYVS